MSSAGLHQVSKLAGTAPADFAKKHSAVVNYWEREGATSRVSYRDSAAELDRLDRAVAASAAELAAAGRLGSTS
jgi:hypothetical protein